MARIPPVQDRLSIARRGKAAPVPAGTGLRRTRRGFNRTPAHGKTEHR